MIDYIVKQLETLVNIPSPSGFTKQAIEYVAKEAAALGYATKRINKGGTVIYVPGKRTGNRFICPCRHLRCHGTFHQRKRNPPPYLYRRFYDGIHRKYLL